MCQGYDIDKNILFQDNKSTILLEENGKKSSSKRTRALNIRYFFLTDQIAKGNLIVEYCPTMEMIADYFSKPLQGKLFQKFWRSIMGHDDKQEIDWRVRLSLWDDRSVLDALILHKYIRYFKTRTQKLYWQVKDRPRCDQDPRPTETKMISLFMITTTNRYPIACDKIYY